MYLRLSGYLPTTFCMTFALICGICLPSECLSMNGTEHQYLEVDNRHLEYKRTSFQKLKIVII